MIDRDDRIKILLLHDRHEINQSLPEYLRRRGFEVITCRSLAEFKDFQKSGGGLGDIIAMLIHKDLGAHSGENVDLDRLMEELRNDHETIRYGILSGEYPDGEAHVLRLKADFYLDPGNIKDNWDWFNNEIRKGYLSPDEIAKRGIELAIPPNLSYSIERLY